MTTSDHVSGTHSLTDSPAGNYSNNVDASATVQLDLSGVSRPVLTFSDRYLLETYADFGYVEVSADGTNWTRLFFATGGAAWQDEQIDLSEYADKSPVWLRFRLVTNGSQPYDGWYIDDVQIIDNTTTIPYPFFDNMESASSDSNWIASTWERIGTDGHSGTDSWTESPNGNSVDDVSSSRRAKILAL